MKRLFSIITFVLLGINALQAEEKLNGLMLTFKDESREAATELFAYNPVLSHSADGKTIIITEGDRVVLSVEASEVKEMTFCEIKDTPTGLSQIVMPKGESLDVYNLSGSKVSLSNTNGVVIVNGKKVLVR